MEQTNHLKQRMHERGISEADLRLVEELGISISVNRSIHKVLNKKTCEKILECLKMFECSTASCS